MTAQIIPFKIERQQDGEFRISDAELAGHLGYAEVRYFRQAIRKNLSDISELDFCVIVTQKSSGGRPEKIYWLTERQAIHMVYRADTPVARELAIKLTKAFVELRRKTRLEMPLPEFFRLSLVNDQVRQWQREYPDGFFVDLHRVLGLDRPAIGNHSNCAHFINRYIYKFLFGELGLTAIRDANPADEEHVRAHKHHQVLKAKHMPALRQHIEKVATILSCAISLRQFDDLFNRRFPSVNTQIGFMFGEMPVMAGRLIQEARS
ncbi:hypothetical protein AA11826_0769 [Komagataeibacter oboediens DSM 11826]|nr:P63C domain-containing protein [Komagataeibacter oboediens]GBR31284.1 hypothetical protein AA11826_0769 [Komagataeibacter oboediens DSM 11826]